MLHCEIVLRRGGGVCHLDAASCTGRRVFTGRGYVAMRWCLSLPSDFRVVTGRLNIAIEFVLTSPHQK